MNAATLLTAAIHMRRHHGPEHERHVFWSALSDWLIDEMAMAKYREARAAQVSDEAMTNVEPKYDMSTQSAFTVARAYLGETL